MTRGQTARRSCNGGLAAGARAGEGVDVEEWRMAGIARKEPEPVRLVDDRPPDWLVDRVELS